MACGSAAGAGAAEFLCGTVCRTIRQSARGARFLRSFYSRSQQYWIASCCGKPWAVGGTSSKDNDGRDPPPSAESITHLYDARGIVDKWLGHPTFWGMLSEDALAKGEGSKDGPPGEGPVLRWQTRIVLEPGGDGFHPANRKVSVAVYVKELRLSRDAKARLLALVGKRYNRSKDELTIISERYEHREENRKDVLRTLIALINEAKQGPSLEGPVSIQA